MKARKKRKKPSITYSSYHAMLGRCLQPVTHGYHNYGGRGIKVCRRWRGRGGFARFVKDMGPRPSKRYSIERKKVNQNYTPKNCLWVVWTEQYNNMRQTVRITAFGRTDTVRGWAKRMSIAAPTLRQRLRLGWPIEKALKSETWPLKSEVGLAAHRLGISPYTIYDRIRNGWPLEQALTSPSMAGVHRSRRV